MLPEPSPSPPTTAWERSVSCTWRTSAATGPGRHNIAAFGGDRGNITLGDSPPVSPASGRCSPGPVRRALPQGRLQSGRTSGFCDRATATPMTEDLIAAPSLDDAEGLRTISVRRILDR